LGPALRQAHVWTAPAVQEEFGVDAKWGASHVFGLLLRH
jgi:hypothetical protein